MKRSPQLCESEEQAIIFEAKKLDVGYGEIPVLHGITLHVKEGEMVALLGANGAGKTTTLLALAGELRPRRGLATFHRASASDGLARRAQLGLGFVTEERSVFMELTCLENLRLGRGSVEAALEFMPELKALLRRKAGLLSGGEQQMLSLARVVASRPVAIMADELSLGLAPLIVDRLMAALQQAARAGIAVLVVEQHVRKALTVCDRAYVLRQGTMVLEGDSSSMLSRINDIEDSYLSTPN
jgi:branched-chain amino acid transport system ATP-binding protein